MRKENLASDQAERVETTTIEDLLDELAQVNKGIHLAANERNEALTRQLVGRQTELSVQIFKQRKSLLTQGKTVPVDVVLLLGNPMEEIHPFSRNRVQLCFTDKNGIRRIVGNSIDKLARICTSRDSSEFFREFVSPNYIIGREIPLNHFKTTCLEINSIDTAREKAHKAFNLDRENSLLELEERLIIERLMPAWLDVGYKSAMLELFDRKGYQKMMVKFFSPIFRSFFLPFSRYSPDTQAKIQAAIADHA